jgi:trigger factor
MPVQIRSEVKALSPVERELAIVVPGAEVAKELDKAYRQLAQKVRIKGFRQGKVPRYVLEQYYKQDTEQQVLERLVGESFRVAVQNHSLEPVANPTIDGRPEIIPGMDFAYSARVEVKPVIELKKWQGLKLEKTTYEVADADVAKEIEALRERQARVVTVEDRDVVQQGDLVECNWSGTVDGEHAKGLSGVQYVIEVGAGRFYKEAEQALVGKKLADSFTVDVVLPDTFATEALRGKTAQLTLRPLVIKKKNLPALDDEFAKDVDDELESLDALKAKIKESLAKQAEQRTKAELRDKAIDALVNENPFDVPQSLVERQAEQLAVDRISRLPQQQAEMIWQQNHVRLKEDARPTALRQVRVSLLLEELVKKEGLEVSDQDIEDHFEKMATDVGTTVKNLKNIYKKGTRMAELKYQLASNRMLEKVVDGAEVTETKKPLYG